MRICLILFFFLFPGLLIGQENPSSRRVIRSVESRQGHHPDGADLIGHMSVHAGDLFRCDLVEIYDETSQEQTACVIRYGDGSKYTLNFGKSMAAPKKGNVYLECLGDKPRRCMLSKNIPLSTVEMQ